MPTYTYRCEQGHEWDEVRSLTEESKVSKDPCQTCVENLDRLGIDLDNTGEPGHEDLSEFAGRKVPSSGSGTLIKGRGLTPKFYPNRGK